jgi:hypothetical protein
MIQLTKHTEEAVERRDIAFDWIDRTVAIPDFTHTDPDDPTLTHSLKAIDQAGGRILRVCIRSRAMTL